MIPTGRPTKVGPFNVLNLTPREIVVRTKNGLEYVFPPSGLLARMNVAVNHLGEIEGIPIVKTDFTGPVGIPDQDLSVPGTPTLFITSSLVAENARSPYVLSPDTGPTAEKDAAGQIISVRRLQTFYEFHGDEFNETLYGEGYRGK